MWTVDDRGFIVFSDGHVDTSGIGFGSVDLEHNMPAMLSPLVGLPGIEAIVVSGGDVEKSGLRYTYRWEAGLEIPFKEASESPNYCEMPVMDTSVSLYRNDWIVFDYKAQPIKGLFSIPLIPGIAGLSPGDGSAGSGHPGEGKDRDWDSGSGFMFEALFGESPLTIGGGDYTAFYNGVDGEGFCSLPWGRIGYLLCIPAL